MEQKQQTVDKSIKRHKNLVIHNKNEFCVAITVKKGLKEENIFVYSYLIISIY